MTTSWRVKLDQAAKHLAALDAEVKTYVEQAGVAFSYEYEDHDHQIAVRVVGAHEPPVTIGATIGDVLHNLNSALDSVAWEAVVRVTPAPPDRGRWVTFPVTRSPSDFSQSIVGRRNPLPGLSQEHLQVFESLQPWYHHEQARELLGNALADRDYERHGLWRLRQMSNTDKHRTIHPVLARAGLAYVGVPEGADVRWLPADPPPWGPGRVMLRWQLPDGFPVEQFSPAGEVILALSEQDAVREESLRQSLDSMVGTATLAVGVVEHYVLGGG